MQHNYGSEGWGFESLRARETHQEFHDLVGFLFLWQQSLLLASLNQVHRIFQVPFAEIYPLYVTKLERKGRIEEELLEVLTWLTGFDEPELKEKIESKVSLREFFADASLNQHCDKITGVICGVRVEEIEDPLMQKIRYMDKLVDELAKGKAMQKVLRES